MGGSFPLPGRRRALAWLSTVWFAPGLAAQPATPFAPVVPGYRLRYPHDEGSHPEFRLEWWYVTGWLNEASAPLGFQITFFRVRPRLRQENPSLFTPREIIIGHAALSDPARERLVHAQRAARAVLGLAGAEVGRTHVWLDDWRLAQSGRSYHAVIAERTLGMELVLHATQPPLEHGENGYSRKGPAPESASYYYSLPHLRTEGWIARGGQRQPVTGVSWLDHEWSSQLMDEEAAGWDWIGINLDDGGALMAFRMRSRKGDPHWAGGSLRTAEGRLTVFSPGEVRFTPRRTWRSARTGTTYPVAFAIAVGVLEFEIEPLFDDQEHDTRATTGAIYWEGAVRAASRGRRLGRGYLELTGYERRLEL